MSTTAARPRPVPVRHRRLIALGLLGLAAGCAAWAEGAAGLEPVPFISEAGLPLADGETGPVVGAFQVAGAFELSPGLDDFGGISGALVEGETLLLLSDRGRLWRARMVEDAAGNLLDLEGWQGWRLIDRAAPDKGLDTEDLARLQDGRLLVADEGTNRLGVLGPLEDEAIEVDFTPFPRAFPVTRPNLGAEALTVLPDGRLLALSEGEPAASGGLLAALVDPEGAASLAWPRDGSFAPTAADAEGGDVYVLTRRVSLLNGFEAKLWRLEAGRVEAGVSLEPRLLAALGAGMAVDNYEALALRRDRTGRLRLLLVSDDNFNLVQRTLVLDLLLEDLPGRS